MFPLILFILKEMSEAVTPTKQEDNSFENTVNVNFINLRTVSQDGNEVYFKIKKITPLKKLINSYCERQSISSSNVRFLYNGQRILDEQTPKSLEMEDNDVIDVVLQQTGGINC
jgi:small ubiquitin-related modifier